MSVYYYNTNISIYSSVNLNIASLLFSPYYEYHFIIHIKGSNKKFSSPYTWTLFSFYNYHSIIIPNQKCPVLQENISGAYKKRNKRCLEKKIHK